MKQMKVGYEELWQIVPDGTHRGGCVIELSEDVEARIRAAEKEWEECLEILDDLAKERGYV